MEEYYFKEIDSTQDYAKSLSIERKKNFVVFSDIQTKGRGRFLRSWEAPNGGLWFSFDYEFNNNNLFTISIGVAVREVLEKVYETKIKLKWPNDIILDNKKVGGIICEKFNNRVIIGVGINTNIYSINEEKGITFLKYTGKSINNYEVMKEIIKECKKYLEVPSNHIVEKFRENMAFIGEEYWISTLNEKGKILGISSDGKLIVETSNGIKEVFTGEIECI